MDSILYNNGVVIQGMDSSPDNFVLSDVSPHGYSGLERYITWPLENQDDPVSIQLSEEVFKSWRQAAAMLKAGEITQEDYDRWRYRYPEFDTTQRWAKVPSQGLSDMLVDALNEKEEEQ